MTISLELDVYLTPDQIFTYINVPFDVPVGIGRINVAYSYDAAISSDPTLQGGNTVDIGIIDPRGPQFLTQGFRGWSGSARSQFYIASESATPGYMPGEIQAGTWHICLGAYKVAPEGCKVHIDIRLTDAESAQAAAPELLPVRERANCLRNSDHWYKGELHCHTVHSDGDSTVAEVIQIAESLGLNFLAITDHNNRSQQIDLARAQTSLTLIPGYEVTTYYGHWNIWGSGDWIDFRVQSPDDLRSAMQMANDQGYLVSCNHPRPFGPDWAFPEVEDFTAIEVWNGPWELLNDYCLTFWETRLRRGQHFVAVGGSDFHFSKFEHEAHLARPTTFIYCPQEPSAANLLRSLRAGHAFVSESPTGPRIDLRLGDAMMGDTWVRESDPSFTLVIRDGVGSEVQIISDKGMMNRFEVDSIYQIFQFQLTDLSVQYIHVQVIDLTNGRVRAVSNPIYVQTSV